MLGPPKPAEYYEVKLAGKTYLVYYNKELTLEMLEEDCLTKVITHEQAREMKSLIDMYLYGLYIKEENI